MKGYEELSDAGLSERLPKIGVFRNNFSDYKIKINIPEFTSLCPKTGLPDFGRIIITYIPDDWCVELKSLKEYIQAYRNIGIFYENAVNKILEDFVDAVKPKMVKVKGRFNPRGGMSSVIEVSYPRHGREDSNLQP